MHHQWPGVRGGERTDLQGAGGNFSVLLCLVVVAT